MGSRRDRRGRGLAVAESPQPGEGISVRVARTAAVEVHGERRRAARRRCRHRRRGHAVRRVEVDAPDLSPARVRRVVQGLTSRARAETQVDRARAAEGRGEFRARAGARPLDAEDLAGDVVGEEVVAVVIRRPQAERHEGPAGDGPADGTPVVVDGVGHPRGRRPAVRRRAVRAVPLAHVPAVVGAGLGEVDLLPRVLPDVVDEEPRPAVVGVERDAEGIAEAPRKRLAALVPRGRAARRPAVRGAGARERIVRRDVAVAGDAQDLPDEAVLVAERRRSLPRSWTGSRSRIRRRRRSRTGSRPGRTARRPRCGCRRSRGCCRSGPSRPKRRSPPRGGTARPGSRTSRPG